MFVKPAPVGPDLPGTVLRVIDPDTGHPLPETGLEVPETPYWLRRLAEGDVVLDSATTEGTPTEGAQAEATLAEMTAPARRKSSASSAE